MSTVDCGVLPEPDLIGYITLLLVENWLLQQSGGASHCCCWLKTGCYNSPVVHHTVSNGYTISHDLLQLEDVCQGEGVYNSNSVQ